MTQTKQSQKNQTKQNVKINEDDKQKINKIYKEFHEYFDIGAISNLFSALDDLCLSANVSSSQSTGQNKQILNFEAVKNKVELLISRMLHFLGEKNKDDFFGCKFIFDVYLTSLENQKKRKQKQRKQKQTKGA
jgi:hypothetical protein